MEFRLLGPVEVCGDNGPLPVRGAKQRALLTLLLLHANEVLSRDRLIDELWGERPPATAAKALQVYVSQLRKLLEPERRAGEPGKLLESRGPGYVIRLEPGQLDLQRFEALLGEGRRALGAGDPGEAARLLGEALSQWRGPALADVAYEPFAQAAVARLEELRLSALEERIEAELRLGAHAALVGELEALVREHPLREHLRGRLILALYRSGRQAEALEAYQQGRNALVEQLGIEPGAELRELHQAILRQDVALEHALPPSQPTTPPSRGGFVGREHELDKLQAGLEDALRGRGGVFLLVGEPGIGKSRLAEELIERARARGAEILVGRCWEAGGAPAYWPWVQSLRTYVRARQPERLRAELGDGAAEIAQLIPELRQVFPDLPEPPSPESEGARFRLFDAVASLLQAAAQTRPIVLVLDDLHAADEPSLLLLRFLARQVAQTRLLVVGAYRDVDPTPGETLTATLGELGRERVTKRILLCGFDEPTVASYITLASGDVPDAALVDAIHSETEGNPLFVGEVVRLLSAEGAFEAKDVAKLGVPEGVREVIGRRLRHLSPRCNELLTLAAVLGREFDVPALAHVAGAAPDEVLAVLDEAITARVASDLPGTVGRIRFEHALIRDTAYQSVTRARRAQLHRRAGEALEDLYASDLEPHLAEIAHHFFEGLPGGDAEKAMRYAVAAGRRAIRQLAYEEAARLYEMALPLVTDNTARCELLLELGDTRGRAGNVSDSKDAFRDAAELAEAEQLSDHLGRAAFGYGGRIVWEGSRDDQQLIELVERALVAIGDEETPLRVRLLARLAGGPLRDSSFPPELKRARAEEAVAMARRIGDPETLAYALAGYMQAHLSPDEYEELVPVAQEWSRPSWQPGTRNGRWKRTSICSSTCSASVRRRPRGRA
ncbi:MAG: AAA family ATPase [Actinomycetota bacterium]|nr:AAA family ATPase [Actinomycetota bacterium]